MLATGVILSLRAILENLISTLEKEQKARQQLYDVSDHWERKVTQRTHELKRLSTQLALNAEINRAAHTQNKPEELLNQVATLLLEKLELDHVAIFLLERNRRLARLRVAAGENASLWLAEGRAVQAGDGSLVGWCLERGQSRMAMERHELVPPLLPETQTAMGLPLRIGGQLIGAIELQTSRTAAYYNQDLSTFQETADQIAMAMETAYLLQKSKAEQDPEGDPSFNQAQRLSSRERIVSAVTAKMRETLDLETVLRTAAHEIGEELGLAAVDVTLFAPEPDNGESARGRTSLGSLDKDHGPDDQ
jgi:GAF domain-containing protein